MISTSAFQKEIWRFYKLHKREFPWRDTRDPYHILVSEVMLQQTQVKRVLVFYAAFIKRFPSVQKLAEAPLSDVLRLWQGLGYNRRALMLHKTAQIITRDYGGRFPKNYNSLLAFPGVGPSTAAGIMNFAFGVPTPYLETNVRSVYLHFYFNDASCKLVDDKEILPLIKKTMPEKLDSRRSFTLGTRGGGNDKAGTREWFYALLDHGAMIKKTHGNPNAKSKHYTKQSPFEGSTRQARAALLRKALKSGAGQKRLLKLLS